MYVIEAENVNDALSQGISLMIREGEYLSSRGGLTMEVPFPVATVYKKPWERVLISKSRDANPFFHLMESLWILFGREDVKFLTEFNKRMADYSDNGQVFNAPYGYRMRNGIGFTHDQLATVIETLREDTHSRQAVLQIWDDTDLTIKTKDKACNMSVVFRIRDDGKLHMIVYNRSNDMIWGAYGANVVQFSMLMEYVAAHLGLPLGHYTQVSNSYHVYLEGPGGELWESLQTDFEHGENPYERVYEQTYMTCADMPAFEHDLAQFFAVYDQFGLKEIGEITYWQSTYFNHVVLPVLSIYLLYKDKGANIALQFTDRIMSDDWKMACEDWLQKRVKNS